jgi:DNA-binding GntR family transcriptional regulator
MPETTYIPDLNLSGFCTRPFVKGSLFETLNVNYSIEITSVEQNLRAVQADKELAEHLSVYSSLLCNTDRYSTGNKLQENLLYSF